MQVHILSHEAAIGRMAGEIIANIITHKPNAVLGLATGSTPLPVYKDLIGRGLDFSQVSSYNLDEYVGLAKTDPQSYHYYMKQALFNHINIDPNQTHLPDGMAADPHQEALDFEAKIQAAGGVDVQILGIGENAHIGFNEPGDYFELGTRVATLAQSTVDANAIYFDKKEDVPTTALTMGIGTIMKAKKIILIATGTKKAQAVAAMLTQKITPAVPASILHVHPDVTVLLDKAAAATIK